MVCALPAGWRPCGAHENSTQGYDDDPLSVCYVGRIRERPGVLRPKHAMPSRRRTYVCLTIGGRYQRSRGRPKRHAGWVPLRRQRHRRRAARHDRERSAAALATIATQVTSSFWSERCNHQRQIKNLPSPTRAPTYEFAHRELRHQRKGTEYAQGTKGEVGCNQFSAPYECTETLVCHLYSL